MDNRIRDYLRDMALVRSRKMGGDCFGDFLGSGLVHHRAGSTAHGLTRYGGKRNAKLVAAMKECKRKANIMRGKCNMEARRTTKRVPSAWNIFLKAYLEENKMNGSPLTFGEVSKMASAAYKQHKMPSVKAPKKVPVPKQKKLTYVNVPHYTDEADIVDDNIEDLEEYYPNPHDFVDDMEEDEADVLDFIDPADHYAHREQLADDDYFSDVYEHPSLVNAHAPEYYDY